MIYNRWQQWYLENIDSIIVPTFLIPSRTLKRFLIQWFWNKLLRNWTTVSNRSPIQNACNSSQEYHGTRLNPKYFAARKLPDTSYYLLCFSRSSKIDCVLTTVGLRGLIFYSLFLIKLSKRVIRTFKKSTERLLVSWKLNNKPMHTRIRLAW